MFKFAFVLAFFQIVSSDRSLSNCLSDYKYCFGFPKNCLGKQCVFAYSFISNGTHMEIEIAANRLLLKTFVAIGYSEDKVMDDDFVISCARDDDHEETERKIMLGTNSFHKNNKIGLLSNLTEENDLGFNLQLLEYESKDNHLYCKLTHEIAPIVDKFNTTNIEIFIASGVWIKDQLTYHGRSRSMAGHGDISGAKKRIVPVSSSNLNNSFISIVTSYIFYKLFKN